MINKWHLFLKQESKDIIIKSFSTKQKAMEEFNNRKNLCDVLKVDFSKTYYIDNLS